MFAVYVMFHGKGTLLILLIMYQNHKKSVKFLVGHYHKLNNCQISSKPVLFAKTRKI